MLVWLYNKYFKKIKPSNLLLPYKILDFNPMSSLVIFAVMTQDEYDKGTDIVDKLYWRDSDAPDGYGPFSSIYDTLENYKKIANYRKQVGFFVAPTDLPPNVISLIAYKAKRK